MKQRYSGTLGYEFNSFRDGVHKVNYSCAEARFNVNGLIQGLSTGGPRPSGGHRGVFSGPQGINQNESNMYNEVIIIEKLEANSKR